MDGELDLDVPLMHPVDLEGVKVTYFPVPRMRRLAWAPMLARRLRQTIHSFDVVHLHSVFLWPTWAAARIASRADKPYFLSPRGMLVRDLIKRKSRWVKTAWIQLIERQTLASATGIHVTAELEEAEMRKLGLILPKVHCVPNGVRWPKEHMPLSTGRFADLPRPYALFLSRINWKKGIDRLIRAWALVPALHLVVAGNDEEKYLPTLKALIDQLGVANRVLFVGPVSDTDKWALYENAIMFILPSYSENFGNVVAEAMAMSCPVIVTEQVGLAKIVRECGAGVVTAGEPKALAETVSYLMDRVSERKEMGRRGLRLAVDQLSWDAVATRIESMYLSAAEAAQDASSNRDSTRAQTRATRKTTPDGG
jgi:glycosyltransferase involved in cell wall biosynthesis